MPVFPVLSVAGLRLEFLTPWQAALLFAVPATLTVLLALRSMAGVGPVRKWTAVGVRLLLILVLVLVVGGLRLERRTEDAEVLVVRDISLSTSRVNSFPLGSLNASFDRFVADVTATKPANDRIGLITFAQQALIEAMPQKAAGALSGGATVVRDVAAGTDIASALQLALATFSDDAMKRIVLVTDGNSTLGDLDSALTQAASQKIPIDVVPLRYASTGEVLLDRLTTPTWRREKEPFTMDIVLRSTAPGGVAGKLTVLHQGLPMAIGLPGDKDPNSRRLVLKPGVNVERIAVPALQRPGVHEFKAVFEPDEATAGADVSVQSASAPPSAAARTATPEASGVSSALLANRTATGFTFVRGRGQILYIDNTPQGAGRLLTDALASEGIEIRPENVRPPEGFPTSLLQLQDYDAVILANVPRGVGGLSDDQQRVLASYVHELGGGLVMIGGEETFGAGGWAGTDLERVLPVDMDVPSRREIAKGALAMIMHSCEFPDGNFWGEQCAIKAAETLSSRDEIGVLSYAWRGAGGGGSQWDFPLSVKGDGGKVIAAIKNMQLGDMPSFDDSFDVALNGRGGNPGLKDSDARQKHVIVISDGDPAAPRESLYQAYVDAKITVSTVSVYPHDTSDLGLPPTMREIARRLKGRAYGPINDNPQQLPQIFIKEASVVKRSLIQEDAKGIPLRQAPALTEAVKGIAVPGSVTGYVLTSRKPSPQVEVPIVAGKESDPVLAYWQTGLGRSVVFTSDAYNRWAASWYASPIYSRFWAQVVRAVARPPMNAELDVTTLPASGGSAGGGGGDKGKIIVEAVRNQQGAPGTPGGGYESFLNIRGTVVGPDLQPREVRLVQTAPGTYEALFDTPQQGNYVVSLRYSAPDGRSGFLLSGLARSASPELRDLRSNEAVLNEIATRTGGRVLPPWQPQANDWFTRAGLVPKVVPLPVWDRLIPLALLLLLLDVMLRRVALDRAMLLGLWKKFVGYIQGFTHTTRDDLEKASPQSLETLRRKREEVQLATPSGTGIAPPSPPSLASSISPVPEGDLSTLVGGATASDTPRPDRPKPAEKPPQGDAVSGLMAAKKRAQQKIDEKKNE